MAIAHLTDLLHRLLSILYLVTVEAFAQENHIQHLAIGQHVYQGRVKSRCTGEGAIRVQAKGGNDAGRS